MKKTFLILIFLCHRLYGFSQVSHKDSIFSIYVNYWCDLKEYESINCQVDTNFPLNVSKRFAKSIINRVIIPKYGFRLNFQRPFRFIRYKHYWIVCGRKRFGNKPFNGRFIVVVDIRNGAVVCNGIEK